MATRLFDDRIIVRPIEDTTTPIYTFRDDKAPLMGEVVSVGPGKTLPSGIVRPMQVEVGDKVAFGRYAIQDLAHMPGHVLIREDDVLAVL